jgi:DNA-directed RNA polymerase subunit alpha
MSRTIRVDDEVFAWLQKKAIALVDSPNSVLRRVAGIDVSFNQNMLRPVSELELSPRSANCLENADINYVGDLVQKSDSELLRTPNFGRKGLNEVKELLAGMGLHLDMEVTGWPPEDIEELAAQLEEE